MAGMLQVSTPLSLDSATVTTNVIELGQPALITISNSTGIKASIAPYCSGIYNSKDDSKCEPHLSARITCIGKTRLQHSGVFNDDLSIIATNRIGERNKGKVSLDKSNGEFECTCSPSTLEGLVQSQHSVEG